MPQVTLDYCIVQDAAANLSAGIYKYQNVRFAAAPLVNDGTLAASDVACTTAEDCLFMDIYVPANTTVKKLPVLQWTYGIAGVANGPTFTHGGGATNVAVHDTEQAYIRSRILRWSLQLDRTMSHHTHELHEKNSDVISGINSTADVADKIRMYSPGITDTVISEILALYPENDYASPGLRFSDIEQSFELTSHNLALTNGLHNQTWNATVTLGEATHGTDQDYYCADCAKVSFVFALTGNPNTLWPNDKMEWPLYNTSTNGVEIVFNASMYLQADSLANAKSRFWNKALWY
ncbi:uncharacterized protein EAE98_004842 [Botrytis deweyae]|uniref:Carboxylic ester hydrolase n=1 Tax=Botrytis deweyae TaxID=2478750 RepID=A0ABQ7IPP6_9HELO|nr:uncharacterized protein EAE98_004842 [Botrytis deweyae]KAF7930442.1 hypothetical protein EAE98_004842 [Botrytis deweyae]